MNTQVGIGNDGFPIIGFDFKLIEGMRIGKLTVIKKTTHPEGKSGRWYECLCDCGKRVVKRSDNLKAGATRGGPAAQKNKGCRTCGSEECNHSGITKRNTTGLIQSIHLETNIGGAKIIGVTDYINNNRSTIVVCECDNCKKPFFTARNSKTRTCGCTKGIPPKTIDEYIKQKQCKSKGELAIARGLNDLKLPYVQEKKFLNLVDTTFLPFDFYVCGFYVIEFDGAQHFKPINYFGGEEKYNLLHKHDLMKNRFCWENNIKLVRIPTLDFELDDLNPYKSKFLLTPENEKEYYLKNK